MLDISRITAIEQTGDFDPYLQFGVDGEPLDELLEKECPGFDILNLIPTLDRSLETPEEREVVWTRILPSNGTVNCPILMCEDDRDFYCILVVAEIEVQADLVLWKRFGLDGSNPNESNNVGTMVQWFNNSPSFVFDKAEYEKMIQCFRRSYELAEQELHRKNLW